MKKHAESRLTRLRNIVAKDGGFTLIEVLAVMVIVGLLAAIAIPQIGKFRDRAYLTSMKSDARSLVNAAEDVYAESGNYPAAAPEIDLSPNNSVSDWSFNESGVTFTISNSKNGKTVAVVDSKLVTSAAGSEEEEEEEAGEASTDPDVVAAMMADDILVMAAYFDDYIAEYGDLPNTTKQVGFWTAPTDPAAQTFEHKVTFSHPGTELFDSGRDYFRLRYDLALVNRSIPDVIILVSYSTISGSAVLSPPTIYHL